MSNFVNNPANRQTNQQTNYNKNITSSVKATISLIHVEILTITPGNVHVHQTPTACSQQERDGRSIFNCLNTETNVPVVLGFVPDVLAFCPSCP